MKTAPAAAMATLVALAAIPGARAAVDAGEPGEQHAMFRAGDLLQVGVPLAGLALTFALRPSATAGDGTPAGGLAWGAADAGALLQLDGSPRHDFLAAALRTELATYALKYAVDEQRPNGGQHSFPSGHTASAFMGAEFIRKEYGWGWGAPAYLAAGYVGWSRVASQNHWTRDVLAGAAIGIFSNHDLTALSGRCGIFSIRPALIGGAAGPIERFGAEDSSGGVETKPGLGLQLRLDFGN